MYIFAFFEADIVNVLRGSKARPLVRLLIILITIAGQKKCYIV